METYPGVAVAVLSAALCEARTTVHVVNFGLICPARRRLMARKKVIDGGGKSPKRSKWTRHISIIVLLMIITITHGHDELT